MTWCSLRLALSPPLVCQWCKAALTHRSEISHMEKDWWADWSNLEPLKEILLHRQKTVNKRNLCTHPAYCIWINTITGLQWHIIQQPSYSPHTRLSFICFASTVKWNLVTLPPTNKPPFCPLKITSKLPSCPLTKAGNMLSLHPLGSSKRTATVHYNRLHPFYAFYDNRLLF